VLKLTRQTALQTAKLESEIADHLQNQLSIEKGAQGTKKDNHKLRALIHEKEATIATAMNELSSIRLDTLNIEASNRSMKERLSAIDKDTNSKYELIEKYEMEIRRRNDELGKKQGEMDQLNKKFDSLTGKNQVLVMIDIKSSFFKIFYIRTNQWDHLRPRYIMSQSLL
jgi:coiled-coil domain-containing protein 40